MFKNLQMYAATHVPLLDYDDVEKFPGGFASVEEYLAKYQLGFCHPEFASCVGFIPALEGGSAFVHVDEGHWLMRVEIVSKTVPGDAVRRELKAEIARIQEREDRLVGKREQKELRESIEVEFLPRAFPKTTVVSVWLDTNRDWLLLDASSPAVAETVIELLRKAFGSMPVEPMFKQYPMAAKLDVWFRNGSPDNFSPGDSATFKREKATCTFVGEDLSDEPILQLAEEGRQVVKLGLVHEPTQVSFVLTEDCSLRKISFPDIKDDLDPESLAEKQANDFALQVRTYSQLLADLFGLTYSFDLGGA